MANLVLGWPIYSDVGEIYTPTMSGGSWSASLPLTNLQTREITEVARSADALAASTQFEVDLKVARAVRVMALINLNISSAGTVRIRGSSVSGSYAAPNLVYDSGNITPYPSGATAETLEGQTVSCIHVATAAQTARYWYIEVTDTGNAAGHIDIGRLALCGGWQPTINMVTGAKLGVESESTRTANEAGGGCYQEKPRRRYCNFGLQNLPESEMLANALPMQRIAGTTRQHVFVFDSADDTTEMHHRAFLAVLRELSAIEWPVGTYTSTAFSAMEEL